MVIQVALSSNASTVSIRTKATVCVCVCVCIQLKNADISDMGNTRDYLSYSLYPPARQEDVDIPVFRCLCLPMCRRQLH